MMYRRLSVGKKNRRKEGLMGSEVEKKLFDGRLLRMNKLERQTVWPQNGISEFLALQVEQFWVIMKCRMAVGRGAG